MLEPLKMSPLLAELCEEVAARGVAVELLDKHRSELLVEIDKLRAQREADAVTIADLRSQLVAVTRAPDE